MPSRNFTSGGGVPPSCRYLWTASRPVNTTPEINTSSPTLSARIFSSVKGKLNFVMPAIQPKPARKSSKLKPSQRTQYQRELICPEEHRAAKRQPFWSARTCPRFWKALVAVERRRGCSFHASRCTRLCFADKSRQSSQSGDKSPHSKILAAHEDSDG